MAAEAARGELVAEPPTDRGEQGDRQRDATGLYPRDHGRPQQQNAVAAPVAHADDPRNGKRSSREQSHHDQPSGFVGRHRKRHRDKGRERRDRHSSGRARRRRRRRGTATDHREERERPTKKTRKSNATESSPTAATKTETSTSAGRTPTEGDRREAHERWRDDGEQRSARDPRHLVGWCVHVVLATYVRRRGSKRSRATISPATRSGPARS